MQIQCFYVILIIAMTIAGSFAQMSTEKYSDRGFLPSPKMYRTNRSGDQIADSTDRLDGPSVDEVTNEKLNLERAQRFGISSYTGTGSSYPTTGSGTTGLYSPVKIDLGGILLGSVLGLGAILILPKLLHAFSYSYGGGYARNLEADLGQVSQLISRMDETLSQYNIDSSSCMQRLTCGYIQSAVASSGQGNGTDFDQFVSALSTNTLTDYMLGGSVFQQAIESGRNTQTDCTRVFPSCDIDKATVTKILSNLLPS